MGRAGVLRVIYWDLKHFRVFHKALGEEGKVDFLDPGVDDMVAIEEAVEGEDRAPGEKYLGDGVDDPEVHYKVTGWGSTPGLEVAWLHLEGDCSGVTLKSRLVAYVERGGMAAGRRYWVGRAWDPRQQYLPCPGVDVCQNEGGCNVVSDGAKK